jgi:cytochrome bd-type quinol oxidase subunit 1
MGLSALLLSRLQFAFTVWLQIMFPSFTIGLVTWLTTIEALHLVAGQPAYLIVFDFWLKIFGVAFGLGFVSGIVIALENGAFVATDWSAIIFSPVVWRRSPHLLRGAALFVLPSMLLHPAAGTRVTRGGSRPDADRYHCWQRKRRGK